MKTARFASFLTVAMAAAGILASATSASAQLNQGTVRFSGEVPSYCLFFNSQPGNLAVDPTSANTLTSGQFGGDHAFISVACNASNVAIKSNVVALSPAAFDLESTNVDYTVDADLPSPTNGFINGIMPVDLTVVSNPIIPAGIYVYDVILIVAPE
jgi:hypothetical protein